MNARNAISVGVVSAMVALTLAKAGFAQERQKTKRSQRVKLEQVQVASPDGNVKLTVLPNAERLTFTVTLGDVTLTVATHPRKILDHPAVDVIKSIPAVWDETIVLPDSEIGELVVFARRAGDIWFLAVMCGPEGKTIRVPLSFLSDAQYNATLIRDGKDDSAEVIVERKTTRKSETLEIKLRAGGGFVGRFSKR